MHRSRRLIAAVARVVTLLAGCVVLHAEAPPAAVVVASQSFALDARPCTGTFAAHPLPHTTRSDSEELFFFVANGAGVALADLDDDNRIDIALAGMHAAPSVLL